MTCVYILSVYKCLNNSNNITVTIVKRLEENNTKPTSYLRFKNFSTDGHTTLYVYIVQIKQTSQT